jgi:HEAT repeat protein
MQHSRMLGLVLFLALCGGGCGKKPPALAGGKPVPYWIETLHNADPRLRKQAAFKLGNVGPADAEALPALIAALKDRDAAVRCEVILALLKCGPAAVEAVPALTDLRQRDPNAQVRRYAAKAIEKLAN